MIKQITLKIKNMHCASCAMNIDGALEDTKGVLEARTSYAKQEVEVKYDPEAVSEQALKDAISKVGYGAEI